MSRPVVTRLRSVATVAATPNATSRTLQPSSSASQESSSLPVGTQRPSPSPATPPSAVNPPSPNPVGHAPKALRAVVSSVPAGTELKGLGYTKAQPKIIAMEDDQYPDWLWKLLDEGKAKSGLPKVDLSAMTKKQRARYDRKMERLQAGVVAPVPLHEQSADLTMPGDDAVTSLQRRTEVTKSARQARRKSIREANFLKTM